MYKSQSSIKQLKKCASLLGESIILGQQNRINSLLPAISSSFHSEDQPLMIVGTKISKKSIAKLDSYYSLLSSTIKIQ